MLYAYQAALINAISGASEIHHAFPEGRTHQLAVRIEHARFEEAEGHVENVGRITVLLLFLCQHLTACHDCAQLTCREARFQCRIAWYTSGFRDTGAGISGLQLIRLLLVF